MTIFKKSDTKKNYGGPEFLINLGLLLASIVILFTMLSLLARSLRISPIKSSSYFNLNPQTNNYETNKISHPHFLFQSFPKYKNSNSYRIFIFGGSSIAHLKYCMFLKEQLTKEFPSRHFEIINAGVSSYGTTRLMPIVAEAVNYNPDLFIIYSGHNEFLEKFLLEVPLIKYMKAMHEYLLRFRGYVLLVKIFNKIRLSPFKKSVKIIWAYPYSATEREIVYKRYESNMRKIINLAKEKKVDIIISTVAYNYVDDRYISPLYYSPRHKNTKFSPSQIAIDSIPDSKLFELVNISREDPYIENRLGLYYLKKRNYVKARKYFINAAKNDFQPFRANAVTNGIVRNISRDLSIPLADVELAITQLSPNQIPNRSLFGNNWCHLNNEGNRIMQVVFFHAIKNRITSTSVVNGLIPANSGDIYLTNSVRVPELEK